ncbi:MAG: hypothetical protein IIA60_11415, partial [Candidatus Marinimicrobia bacterium]|nr:hypothetical protein [Candidatus Neomarinimicrobiota bacterium]
YIKQGLSIYYPVDSNDVALYESDGELYYHPVKIAKMALYFLDGYAQTGNIEYIERAEQYMNTLIDLAHEYDGVLYYNYSFDWPLHRIETDVMVSPWYSGMAEGQSLSALVRLYKVTGKEKYLTAAEKTFDSFLRFRRSSVPWVVRIDVQNYYWIEEWPWTIPTQALNGFIFAIFGLYDYYQLTSDPVCKKLLQAGLTTIRDYADAYRVEGAMSLYCLYHRLPVEFYHQVHIDQMWQLFLITGDSYFYDMSRKLAEDYTPGELTQVKNGLEKSPSFEEFHFPKH